MTTRTAAEVPPLLAAVLDGLIPLQLAVLADLSEGDRKRLADKYADRIAASGDRLTAPGNFDDRRERSAALTALAGGIALGAMQPGGITWGGRHWCTEPHLGCAVNPVNAPQGLTA